jgi:hypothetical protein
VILEIVKHDVYDTHVPTTQHEILAAIQLIKVKVKGIDHACIYSEAARENFLAAKQQRKIVVQTFFTHNPLLVHDVLLLYNVEQTLTLVRYQWVANICNDSNELPRLACESVPMSKLMIPLGLDLS